MNVRILLLTLSCLLLEETTHVLAQAVKSLEEKAKDTKKQDSEEECSALRNEAKTLEISNKALKNEIFLCNQKDRCPPKGPDGIYKITIGGRKTARTTNTFKAPCKKGGWMIFQRRIDGSENFNRGWKQYKTGFGNIKREFFIGLEKLHLITKAHRCEVSIELRDASGNRRFALYDQFEIGSERESYNLKVVGNYSGTAGDSLKYHEKAKFSTYDRDNDSHTDNCAKHHHGGWWFKKCATSSLNGKYYKSGKKPEGKDYGIFWGSWNRDYDYNISLTHAVMMIKPKCSMETVPMIMEKISRK
ncbi:fibroleukin-like [Drosophila biarmipes]|uniref:fibroleukin-like n=1 Tax=Drosophila biarmipes TaxID=125945 RepID=UPI0007E5FDDB|nr:fibroleukin-like [Drosophila biarmipes]